MGGIRERVMEDVERRGGTDLELERRLARGVEHTDGEAVVLAIPEERDADPVALAAHQLFELCGGSVRFVAVIVGSSGCRV